MRFLTICPSCPQETVDDVARSPQLFYDRTFPWPFWVRFCSDSIPPSSLCTRRLLTQDCVRS